MRVVTALVEIGAAVPSVLDTLLGCDAATALETARRAACTGAVAVLDDAPPAMLHPSKLPASNILYGGQRPCPVADGPYCTAARNFDWKVDGQCVGAVMIDVCKDAARPAVVCAEQSDSGAMIIKLYVHDAPLAAMEAELFNGNGLPSGFEAKWLGEQAKPAKELRQQVGAWVRKQGYDLMPPWMHSKDNWVVLKRPGVLPLLRVRKASTAEEEVMVRSMLQRWPTPAAGFAHLKNLLEAAGDADKAVLVETNFIQGPPLEPRSEGHCLPAFKWSVVGSLALAVLQHLHNDDYYGVVLERDEDDEKQAEGGEEEEEEDGGKGDSGELTDKETDGNGLRSVVEDIEAREGSAVELQEEGPALSYRGDDVLMRLVGPTLRACALKNVVRAATEHDAAFAVVEKAFCAADVRILADGMRTRDSFADMMTEAGRAMASRYAFLVLPKSKDGTLKDCRLVSQEGVTSLVALESITRYVLFPWVLPVVLDDDGVCEVQIQGVARERFRVSEVRRTEAMDKWRNAVPEEIATFIRDATQGLSAIPSLVSRLGSIETQLGAAAAAGAFAGPSVPGTPFAPPSTSCEPATPEREMSETQRGFKRMIEQIEAYDAAVQRGF